MPKNTTVETLKDGWIKRDSASGRFLEVGRNITTSKGVAAQAGRTMTGVHGVTKLSKKSSKAIDEIAVRRSAALERLKDR